MTKPVDTKKMEQIARRMGYSGPMSKFAEFLMSSPRGYAEGGVVTNNKGDSQNQVNKAADKVFQQQIKTYTNNAKPKNFDATTVTSTPITAQSNQFIDPKTGQITGALPSTNVATGQATQAGAPTGVNTSTYDAAQVGNSVEGVIDQFKTAQGTVNSESTVKGQLEGLMQDFEGGNTPAWAAGALRTADAQNLARGLGASSMAGAARTQAAMEAALPIALQDASVNAQMQFQNLANEQQTFMLGNEARLNSLFSDVASENASRQFNATSENQTRQFNESLKASVKMFNAEQVNGMTQFNVGQKNAMTQFRATMQEERSKFNSTNGLIIAQANAQWRQEIATINNANINEANRVNAQLKTNVTLAEMNNYFQERRDVMQFAWQSGENEKNRALELMMQQMSIDEMERQGDQDSRNGLWEIAGAFVAEWMR